ncbi:MAG TPA: membrane-bound lytic murein transglycosylase MltF [Burkholderiales bacterium]|nr:membrane-bound lytic murein transglycosylase MltF [Burkholderiales bacterium]
MRKLVLSFALLLPLICDPLFVPERPVVSPAKLGELIVLTRNTPTTRYIDADGQYRGLEHDLVELFAKDLGVKVHYVDRQPLYRILTSLQHHEAHLAAAGIAVTSSSLDEFQFAPSYQMTQSVLAYNTDDGPPRSPADLVGERIEVVKGSASIEDLRVLRKRFPKLRWHEVAESDSEGLLARLSEGKSDVVVTESHVLDVVRKFHPNIARAFSIGDPKPLAWVFPKGSDSSLIQRAEEFFLRITRDGTLAQLLERYYGHSERLDRLDIANFLERRLTVLPRYKRWFKEAQDVSGIDWRLLAALGFQESHWDPLATSPTGVRGVMMLTEETADRMKVQDRLEPRSNILAGARYLAEIRDMLPDRIQEPDRTWLALAAYNQGFGHMEDGRILAQRKKMNPDLWSNVKRTLPLLSVYEHYSTVKHGFCRGGEAVILTENIRAYYDILLRFEAPHVPSMRLLSTNGARVSGAVR